MCCMKLWGRSHDPGNRAGPLSGIHLNIFHPGRRDGVFIWENSSPLIAGQPVHPDERNGIFNRNITMSRDLGYRDLRAVDMGDGTERLPGRDDFYPGNVIHIMILISDTENT